MSSASSPSPPQCSSAKIYLAGPANKFKIQNQTQAHNDYPSCIFSSHLERNPVDEICCSKIQSRIISSLSKQIRTRYRRWTLQKFETPILVNSIVWTLDNLNQTQQNLQTKRRSYRELVQRSLGIGVGRFLQVTPEELGRGNGFGVGEFPPRLLSFLHLELGGARLLRIRVRVRVPTLHPESEFSEEGRRFGWSHMPQHRRRPSRRIHLRVRLRILQILKPTTKRGSTRRSTVGRRCRNRRRWLLRFLVVHILTRLHHYSHYYNRNTWRGI